MERGSLKAQMPMVLGYQTETPLGFLSQVHFPKKARTVARIGTLHRLSAFGGLATLHGCTGQLPVANWESECRQGKGLVSPQRCVGCERAHKLLQHL